MSDIFNALVYNPLYNALVGIVSIVPYAELGIAVIVLTVAVKFLLFPISLKAAKTQQIIRLMQPKLEALKEQYKEDRQALALKTMELYREYNISPFSLFIPLLIQIPIILGLFWVFSSGGLPSINTDILYSFIPTPATIDMNFLGLINVAERNILLALLTGLTQYIQMHIVMPEIAKRKDNASFSDDFQRSFQLQMKYVFPVIITGIAYALPAAVALYWITSNLFQIAQEMYVKKHIRNEA